VDDIKFFDTILPSTGLRCIALITPKGKWHHLWGETNAWLAQISKQIDTSRNIDVYYGCSSFTPTARDVVPADGGGRKQINVAWVRSFWVDLDVGVSEPGKAPKYATQKLAVTAVVKFARDHGLPQPWLVNSGWGVHAYWPTDADMPVSVWKPIAEALKRALRASGVLFDPSRTADEASVLRPPGTHNHKRQPKPVKIGAVGPVSPLAAIAGPMASFIQQAPASIATAQLSSMNAALGGGMGPDPSSALLMADHCGVMGMMRDTRGNLDQPTWYYSLGVLLHTDEAPAICHDWSNGHPNYSFAETQANLARLAKHGATTCDKLSEYQPAVCKACPHFGKITSPIQLGRQRVEKTTVETVERVVDKKGFVTETVASLELPWPFKEIVKNGKRVLAHTATTVDKDGKETKKTDAVANTLFWGLTRMWDVDGAVYEFEMLTREGTRRFRVKGSLIGPGGRELSAELSRNEIVAPQGKGAVLHNYMSLWLDQLSKNADQVKAHRSFGWALEGDFVLGDTIIRPDGSETRSMLTGIAEGKQAAVSRVGDARTWVALVDRAYNAPGQEAFQFQIACAFAAPLLCLLRQVNGVTVYSHTDGSGKGKTTVQKVGLSAWGHPNKMMLAQDKATANSLWGIFGTYNSLPIVYDELTNIPMKEVSELVFSMSSGRAKERMTASGDLRANNSNWSTIMLASGNILLSEKLAQYRANTEAEISRLFEFTLAVDPHLTVIEANALFPQFEENYGHAGYKFAKAIVKNRADIETALRNTQTQLIHKLKLTQVERHWSALFASVIVALKVCRSLKLLAFEVEPIEAWIAARLEENRGQRAEMIIDYKDLLSQMLNELWEDVLVTDGVGNIRHNIPVNIQKPPRGAIVGRRVIPTATDPLPSLEIAVAAVYAWCAPKMVSPKVMLAKAVELKWASPKPVRVGLGRGTKQYSSSNNTYCWKFFPDVMDDVAVVQQHLSVVKGGKP
jgi:hypothetical protein